ncbi:tetratricopeptide repeat protein, partial [bacterium]|nr:tetratricopeptide repeat protein [candidate division CSSED10-310 bacterium]
INQTAQLIGNDHYKSEGSLSLPSCELWQNLGSAIYHEARNEWVYSENLYRDVLIIDSTISSVYKNLAFVLMQQSLIEGSGGQIALDKLYNAETILKRAHRLNPTDTDVYRLLGTLYIHHEWWNRAEEAFLKAFQGNQEDPFLYFFISRLHPSRFRRFGFRTRESLLKNAIKINPALVWAYLSLGEEYYFKQKYRESEKIIHQLLTICPNSGDGLFMLGKLYLLQNEWVKMIRCYERILKVTPNFPDVLYNMGIMAYHERKLDQALTFFKRAMELDNNSGAAFYRAKIFELMGEVDSAAVMYRERLKLRKGPYDNYANEAAENLRIYLQTKEATH